MDRWRRRWRKIHRRFLFEALSRAKYNSSNQEITFVRKYLAVVLAVSLFPFAFHAEEKKKAITLDEYLNTTEIIAVRLSPDGTAAVIETQAPDWKASQYRIDLWIWTAAGGLRPLTHSGNEASVQWSPDGKWIAFLTDRSPLLPSDEPGDDASAEPTVRLWIISASGGEALPFFAEELDVHAFAWAPDSASIYYSVEQPLSSDERATQKEDWKDVVRWREQHRGDLLLKQALQPSIEAALATPLPKHEESSGKKDKKQKKKEKDETATELPKLATEITSSQLEIAEIEPSHDGKTIAFTTASKHHRIENPADDEIYLVAAETNATARQLTHNEGGESDVLWSPDDKFIHFINHAGAGFIEGDYKDLQGRLYRISVEDGKVERLGAAFGGSFEGFVLLPDGREIAEGLKGLERQLYLVAGADAQSIPGEPGAYAGISAARSSNALLFVHSSINHPWQAILAPDALHPTEKTTQLTKLNPVFAERAQPEWKAFNWTSPDGHAMEGVLIFPPGKLNAKHLRMLTLIHGGPEDADGNYFAADWYDWATLAASNGWLVFRPNYRGSTGYGDDIMLAISPHLVSGPGLDILSGVDAIVKEGYADAEKLTIGGYSYGGYMTNWLITQTERFKAAVTGAGAVEHAANWGNDDLTYDDAWYLGGAPWENPAIYQSEAALFQFNKVKTPVHLVQGDADVRVSYLEGVTMERALEKLKIPHEFVVFPGEGHGLPKNPWHGYIKVREELKWLEKYVPEK
jgi:dipeptidyl aminopeptidase/acylaminoacyl peptidase